MTSEERLVHLRAGLKYHSDQLTRWVRIYEVFGRSPQDKRTCNYHRRQVNWFERTIKRVERSIT